MAGLFEGRVGVSYYQIYVLSADQFVSDPELASVGQLNGLCGAAVPGALLLTTGLHTGSTHFTVLRYDQEPPVDETWEEIVEVSYRPLGPPVNLVEWADEDRYPLELSVQDYRVRYCASGMDAASEADVVMDDEPLLDRYLLQFWPAPIQPDAILKQTSETAAHWHQAWGAAPADETSMSQEA